MNIPASRGVLTGSTSRVVGGGVYELFVDGTDQLDRDDVEAIRKQGSLSRLQVRTTEKFLHPFQVPIVRNCLRRRRKQVAVEGLAQPLEQLLAGSAIAQYTGQIPVAADAAQAAAVDDLSIDQILREDGATDEPLRLVPAETVVDQHPFEVVEVT